MLEQGFIRMLLTVFGCAMVGCLVAIVLRFLNRKNEGPRVDQVAAVGALVGAAFGVLFAIFNAMLNKL